MEKRIFLACADRGLARAQHNPGGAWSVEHLSTEKRFTCLASDPTNPATILAGTHEGVFRSDDTGLNWRPSGMQGHIVKSLAISPHDSRTILAGTKPALVYRSDDGGDSWHELEGFRRIPNRWWWFSPADPPDWRPYVISVAISPTDPDVVLAGVEFGAVVRSEDGGLTWSRHLRRALRDCHSLKFHARDGRWAYQAGGTGGGAAFSQDGGQTWQKARHGLAKNYGIVCAADPARPEIWYICVAPSPFNAFGDHPQIYLYRMDGSAGWIPIGWQDHPLSETPTALVTVLDAPGHLYAGLSNGDIWHTADRGDSWEKLPFNMGGIWFSMLIL